MGTTLASTDADGMLKLWDTRMVRLTTYEQRWGADRTAHDKISLKQAEQALGHSNDAAYYVSKDGGLIVLLMT